MDNFLKHADYFVIAVAYVVAFVFGATGGAISSSIVLGTMGKMKRRVALVYGLTITSGLFAAVFLSAIFSYQFMTGTIVVHSIEVVIHMSIFVGCVTSILSMCANHMLRRVEGRVALKFNNIEVDLTSKDDK